MIFYFIDCLPYLLAARNYLSVGGKAYSEQVVLSGSASLESM